MTPNGKNTQMHVVDPRPEQDPCAPGRCVRLVPGIRRIIADNPSAMTFTGTASYVVGEGSVALIDPGPRPDQADAILAALGDGETVEAIFVTHRHADHTRATDRLRALTGAPVHAGVPMPALPPPTGFLATHAGGGEGIDPAFRADVLLRDGDRIESAFEANGEPGWSLLAVHTPGHLDDHVCFASESHAVLFTGDHVMGWSTSILSPPEGDLGDWLDSVQRMRDRIERGLDRLYLPGHGPAVEDPGRRLDHLCHRRAVRNRSILLHLAEGPKSLEDLQIRCYGTLPALQTYAARRMLLAHLIYLAASGEVRLDRQPAGPRFAQVDRAA